MRIPFLPVLLVCVACGGGEEETDDVRTKPVRTCIPPDGVSGRPTDVEETVALIIALDKPVTLPCLLESLDRPFELLATSNIVSAQPAFGPNNPRLFLILDDLFLSVVPKGKGRELLEFGVRRSATTSVKAEIHFPVTADVAPEDPYDRLLYGSGTPCGFCHTGERPDEEIAFTQAFVSRIVDPPENTVIDREYLDWVWEDCDLSLEPDRCAMFDSIFAHGEVRDGRY